MSDGVATPAGVTPGSGAIADRPPDSFTGDEGLAHPIGVSLPPTGFVLLKGNPCGNDPSDCTNSNGCGRDQEAQVVSWQGLD